MGILNNNGVGPRPQFTHFSHPHPLELTDLATNHQCWGCRISILPGRPYYSCKTCGFCLHRTCFNLPRKISHPAEPNHHLVLVLSPSFHCKACGNPGSGFSFNCKECNHDYHSLCTLKPLSVTNPLHRHPLCLEFKPPYGGQGFQCDLCGNPGLNQWFYSCSDCGFDIHLDCPASKAPSELLENRFDTTNRSVMNLGPVNHVNFYPQPNFNGSYRQNQTVLLTPSNRVPVTTVLHPNGTIGYGGGAMARPIPSRGGSMNGIGGLIAGSIVTGMGQQLGQELVGGLTNGFGGGSGSSDDSGGGFSDIVNCWVGGGFA